MEPNSMEAIDAYIKIEKYSHMLFGRLAIDKGFANYMQLLEVLQEIHEEPKKKIGELLVEKGYLNYDQITEIIAEQHSFRTKKTENWPYIPNTVLKGLMYYGGFSLKKA